VRRANAVSFCASGNSLIGGHSLSGHRLCHRRRLSPSRSHIIVEIFDRVSYAVIRTPNKLRASANSAPAVQSGFPNASVRGSFSHRQITWHLKHSLAFLVTLDDRHFKMPEKISESNDSIFPALLDAKS
jgi:hypothetical protein